MQHKETRPEKVKKILENVATDLSDLHDEIQTIYLASSDITENENIISCPVSVEITGSDAKIFKGADLSADIVFTAQKGQDFKVVDKINDWYAISLGKPVSGINAGWVNASQVVPVPTSSFYSLINKYTNKQSSVTDRMYREIMNSVIGFRDKYKNNPYIKVNGFSIDIGIPPSLSLDFEFK